MMWHIIISFETNKMICVKIKQSQKQEKIRQIMSQFKNGKMSFRKEYIYLQFSEQNQFDMFQEKMNKELNELSQDTYQILGNQHLQLLQRGQLQGKEVSKEDVKLEPSSLTSLTSASLQKKLEDDPKEIIGKPELQIVESGSYDCWKTDDHKDVKEDYSLKNQQAREEPLEPMVCEQSDCFEVQFDDQLQVPQSNQPIQQTELQAISEPLLVKNENSSQKEKNEIEPQNQSITNRSTLEEESLDMADLKGEQKCETVVEESLPCTLTENTEEYIKPQEVAKVYSPLTSEVIQTKVFAKKENRVREETEILPPKAVYSNHFSKKAVSKQQPGSQFWLLAVIIVWIILILALFN